MYKGGFILKKVRY